MKVFRKTGVSTLINILGMSVAFAAAMILMVQVRWDTTYDANFEGHKQVFRMENNWMDKGFVQHVLFPADDRNRQDGQSQYRGCGDLLDYASGGYSEQKW